MLKKFGDFIKEEKLIEKNDKILIALSGGPDSVVLSKLLLEIKEKFSLTIGLCHINHCLRGEESDGDEKFCEEFGEKHELNFYSLKADIVKYSKENKVGLEEAGREIRYEFFYKIAEKNGYNKIALAHNLDDNVETFLFRLMRGTGLNGLKGIPVKRGKIIRPLLNSKKTEILDYLKEIKEKYRIDDSNNESIYTRNKIRLELIPFIEKEFNPKFKDNLNFLIDDLNNIKADNTEFDGLDNFFGNSKNIQKEILYNLLKNNNVEVSRGKIDEILKVLGKEGHKKVSLGKGVILKKSYNSIKIFKESLKLAKNGKIALDIPCKIGYNGYTIETKIVDRVIKEKNSFYFDLEKIKLPIFVKTKEDGDKFLPKGMDSYKKIKKFFIDEKIDKELRDEIPIICFENEVLLIGNFRSSGIAEVLENNNKILLVKIEEGVFSER